MPGFLTYDHGGLERPRMSGGACGQRLRRALVIPSLSPSGRTPGRLFGRRERPSSRTLAHRPIYKCLIQPMPTVVTLPNLSAHKPAGDRASRYKDRPQMPSRCPCLEPIQSQYPAVDRCEADGSHRDPLGSNRRDTAILLKEGRSQRSTKCRFSA